MTTAAILIVVAGPDLPDPPDRVAALGQEAVLDPWVPPDLPELQALPALPVLLDLLHRLFTHNIRNLFGVEYVNR